MQEQQQRIGTRALEDLDPMAAIVVHLALRLPLPCASGQFHLVPATRPAPAAMLLMPCSASHNASAPADSSTIFAPQDTIHRKQLECWLLSGT